MKKLSYAVLAATILAGGLVGAAPAFAAPTGALACNSGNSDDLINNAKQQLSRELQLNTKPASSIDDWNGCLKVQYTDASGHTNVALYDPSSLTLVNQLS
jgi:hypothetical protein